LEQAEETTRRSCALNAVNEVLLKKQEQLRSLASQLTLTEQRERKRLATELHDYLAQLIVLGRLKIGQARPQIDTGDALLARLIGDLDDIFSQCLTYTRTLLAELSPSVLQDLGLPLALKWLAEQMAKHNLAVEVRLSQEHLPLPYDRAILVYQSVRELLLNVVKHAQTNRATVILSVEHSSMVLLVQDHGRGFDPASLQTRTGGDHFGLFSIQERMEAMGGSLQVESTMGHGTRMTILLPLAHILESTSVSSPASIEQGSMKRADATTSGGTRILLVDDHAMVRQGLRAILEDYSDMLVIGEAANGIEAVAMASDLTPDVIIMDVNMPRLDGIAATKRIKAAQPAIIVIGLSVNDSRQVMEAMKGAGADAFLSKEAAPEQLYDAIAALAHPGASSESAQ
jgi:CheY-like chemotaxis protein